MRLFLLSALFCFGLSFSINAQEAKIHWMTVEEVTEAMKKEPRKVMMDVYTSWCGPCKMMMANTFTNPNLISYVNENFYAVKLDAEHPGPIEYQGTTYNNPTYDPNRRGRNGVHELSRALKVNAYPTIVYFDEKFTVITANSGYKQPQQMELMLKFFNDVFSRSTPNDKIQSVWDEYNSNFTGTW
jgi:thioredoxin-related protein